MPRPRDSPARGRGSRVSLFALPVTAKNVAIALIVLLIAAGAVVRAQAIGSNTRVSADEHGYVANANHILVHKRYATFEWPPGTSVLFAVATRLSGHHSLHLSTHARGPAQYAQLAIGVLTLLLIAAMSWIAAGPWAAVIGLALAATYIPLVLATRTYLSEPVGGFMLLAALAAALLARSRLARPHGSLALAAAGVVGALACLTRGDIVIAMGVIALALALSGRPGWRAGLLRASVYLGAVLLTLTPWLVYASEQKGRFVPITIAGTDAFFIGSYLPGRGALVPTEEALAPEVCRHYPEDCGHYWLKSATPLFRLIRDRYPHSSRNAAIMQADLENIRRYALGRPFAFAAMLWHKFWKMWGNAWSGGNGTVHPDTSRTQHLIYAVLAWLGLLGAAALTRRWTLITTAAVLVAIAALATLFNDQPRYNVSLMPLLFAYGSAGLWLLGAEIVRRLRERSAAAVTRAQPLGPDP